MIARNDHVFGFRDVESQVVSSTAATIKLKFVLTSRKMLIAYARMYAGRGRGSSPVAEQQQSIFHTSLSPPAEI